MYSLSTIRHDKHRHVILYILFIRNESSTTLIMLLEFVDSSHVCDIYIADNAPLHTLDITKYFQNESSVHRVCARNEKTKSYLTQKSHKYIYERMLLTVYRTRIKMNTKQEHVCCMLDENSVGCARQRKYTVTTCTQYAYFHFDQ